MTLSATDIELVTQSFDRLEAELETHSKRFYATLFRRAPELRPLFREDLEGQGMKFLTTLRTVIQSLGDADAFAERLKDLSRAHASLGVVAAHFDPMEEALMDTLRDATGAAFTPDVETAWRAAYGEVRDTMVRLGDIPSA